MDDLTPRPELAEDRYVATARIEPMDPMIRDLWASALESGEFEQGDEVLARGDSRTGKVRYCCLGVLCELAVQAGVILPGAQRQEFRTPYETWRVAYGEAEVDLVLPHEVVVWAGLNMASPRVNIVGDAAAMRITNEANTFYSERAVPLETLNDNHHPFKAIAKLIRSSL